MAYEIDGKGNIMVFTFTVRYFSYDGEVYSQSKCFTDYVCGWDWARRIGYDWEGADESNSFNVEVDGEWVEHTDESVKEFAERHETKEDWI